MKFRVIYQHTAPSAHSPARVVEQTTGREIGWINRYLDREYVRRLADKTLRIYAYNLLHFVRWWESVHHTGEVRETDLTEATLREYLCFQSSLQPRPSGSTINDTGRHRRSRPAQRVPRRSLPDRSRLSSSLFTAQADGPGPAEDGPQPNTRQGSPGTRSFRCRSMRWRAFGPASTRRATWPSSA